MRNNRKTCGMSENLIFPVTALKILISSPLFAAKIELYQKRENTHVFIDARMCVHLCVCKHQLSTKLFFKIKAEMVLNGCF